MKTHYEVWVKPDNGPLTVQERDSTGTRWAWLKKQDAINRAMELHCLYPSIHFIVREITQTQIDKVFDTTNR